MEASKNSELNGGAGAVRRAASHQPATSFSSVALSMLHGQRMGEGPLQPTTSTKCELTAGGQGMFPLSEPKADLNNALSADLNNGRRHIEVTLTAGREAPVE